MTRTLPFANRFALVAAVLLASLTLLHAADAPLLDLFPKSNAPTFHDKPSEFVVSTQYSPNQRRPSHWTEGVDEKPVFHAYLTHKSTAERSWELRIGKGGQIYSIVSSCEIGRASCRERVLQVV